MAPSTAPTMAAVGIELPTGWEDFEDPVTATPVVELARADVDITEINMEEDFMIVDLINEVGSVVKLVRDVLVIDGIRLDANPSQIAKVLALVLLTFARCSILTGRTSYPRIACFNQTASCKSRITVVEGATVRAASVAMENLWAHLIDS